MAPLQPILLVNSVLVRVIKHAAGSCGYKYSQFVVTVMLKMILTMLIAMMKAISDQDSDGRNDIDVARDGGDDKDVAALPLLVQLPLVI